MTGHQKSNPQTVQFDVGGRLFKTSRSLIDQHEGTMLVRLVSDTSCQDDPTNPIFIDRNGDTFALILDYLRYGSISLPATVSKETFLRDMEFYGIVPKKGSIESHQVNNWAAQVAQRHKKIESLDNKKAELEVEKLDLQMRNNIDILANYCASMHLQCGSDDVLDMVIDEQDEVDLHGDDMYRENENVALWKAARAVKDCSQNRGRLDRSLSKFGLYVKDAKKTIWSVKLAICTVKTEEVATRAEI